MPEHGANPASITEQQRPVWNRGAESYADAFEARGHVDGGRPSRDRQSISSRINASELTPSRAAT